MHDGALGGEYLPALQLRHSVELRLEYFPFLQDVHRVAPAVTLLVWNPAGHVKQPFSFNAIGAYVPRGHGRHSSEL